MFFTLIITGNFVLVNSVKGSNNTSHLVLVNSVNHSNTTGHRVCQHCDLFKHRTLCGSQYCDLFKHRTLSVNTMNHSNTGHSLVNCYT